MNKEVVAKSIIDKAIESGACAAGIANIEDLKTMPSFVMMPKRPHIDRVGAVEYETGLPEGVVAWPEMAKSILVIAYYHPEEDVFMDTWIDWKNPPGNKNLIGVIRETRAWMAEALPEIETKPMNYYVEKGGVWLKDSAVMAGIGILGKNNILVTPEHGPRVRLRAMYMSEDFPSTGKLDWDPCEKCPEFCRKACPQQAFADVIYDPADYDGQEELPGRTGCYSLMQCDKEMQVNEKRELIGKFELPKYGAAESIVVYCRECEVSCPVGKALEKDTPAARDSEKIRNAACSKFDESAMKEVLESLSVPESEFDTTTKAATDEVG